ncbi:YbaY family lipoprotein [Halothiobacillus sp.]|jgi:uncharacterized lipoprotein YbaY|uniref:YbaY family lipoprotein n=1 Tax=Halothiobacillus sp. TaxID=1891311 RepID=UPI002623DFD4|nr:YbaY family lipoprotein [Halothiobacillus sp.]MDD3576264.1 YbaY family lipoprotein [Halothiobacillus sp.]MDD4967233.1 YbaY family lipoprotein [Halothiobacillus sp.]MDY0147524.1 YbaY family lipoprotein [Halothiobacillus sp.]
MHYKLSSTPLTWSVRTRFCAVLSLLGVTLLGLSGCASFPFFGATPAVTQTDTVFTGSLSYKARIALPTDSTAVIELHDGTQPDQLITEEHIPLNGRQVPIDFQLLIPKGRLMVNHPYLLRASIISANRITWISEPITVSTDKQQLGVVKLKPFETEVFTTAMMCGSTPVMVSGQTDSVTMKIEGQTIKLNRSVSADGARYVAENDPATVFWSKGNTATITLKGTVLPNCLARPDTALSQQ